VEGRQTFSNFTFSAFRILRAFVINFLAYSAPMGESRLSFAGRNAGMLLATLPLAGQHFASKASQATPTAAKPSYKNGLQRRTSKTDGHPNKTFQPA
jgi:hypothetical protein